mmetsp:Transcript_273/g.286  ORF Transcript_273/g.286 Transcript_273/m.286 type:complete len:84 (-) Transcript_273:146-397(-)
MVAEAIPTITTLNMNISAFTKYRNFSKSCKTIFDLGNSGQEVKQFYVGYKNAAQFCFSPKHPVSTTIQGFFFSYRYIKQPRLL